MTDIFVPAAREEFPRFFSQMEYGVGVEVGTYEGAFAAHILENWNGTLHCVDPFIHQEGWRDVLNRSDEEFQTVKQTAITRLQPWLVTGRCVVHELTSLEAAGMWWAKDLDFVYLDARHDFGSVLDDARAWYPTLKPGGFLGGHDYLDTRIGDTVFEVKPAVAQFATEFGYAPDEIYCTFDGTYPSWFLRKHDA